MAGTGRNTTAADPQEELTALAEREGLGTLGELLAVIAFDRESFEPASLVRAAARMDWSEVWDAHVAPLLDQLEDILEDHGALRE